MEKNYITEVEIIDLNYLGKGVAKIDDMVVFVEGAVINDIVKIKIKDVKKNYAIGEILDIVKPSINRIKPECKYYDRCGGCNLMHMNYNFGLEYKRNRVINELSRVKINLDNVKVHDTIAMENPFRYRNKMVFSVSKDKNNIVIGPLEEKSYTTVDIEECLIQPSVADLVLNKIKDLFKKYNVSAYCEKSKKGVVRKIVVRSNQKNEVMVVIVTSTPNMPNKDEIVNGLRESVKEVKTIVQNINIKRDSTIMGCENIVLYGDGVIKDTIEDFEFTISPETFFQVNNEQTNKLYKKAIEFADIKENEVCFDLYCGIGTLTMMASRYSKKVYGVEVVEQSVVNARKNAKINKVENVEFYAGKVEEIVPKLYNKSIVADVVILDPPRSGCEKVVCDTIINMKPNRVVYVSCNPSTLARDLKIFLDEGYILKEVVPVDQFCWSGHVEAVTLLVKE